MKGIAATASIRRRIRRDGEIRESRSGRGRLGPDHGRAAHVLQDEGHLMRCSKDRQMVHRQSVEWKRLASGEVRRTVSVPAPGLS